jgi:hypothetical protein
MTAEQYAQQLADLLSNCVAAMWLCGDRFNDHKAALDGQARVALAAWHHRNAPAPKQQLLI